MSFLGQRGDSSFSKTGKNTKISNLTTQLLQYQVNSGYWTSNEISQAIMQIIKGSKVNMTFRVRVDVGHEPIATYMCAQDKTLAQPNSSSSFHNWDYNREAIKYTNFESYPFLSVYENNVTNVPYGITVQDKCIESGVIVYWCEVNDIEYIYKKLSVLHRHYYHLHIWPYFVNDDWKKPYGIVHNLFKVVRSRA